MEKKHICKFCGEEFETGQKLGNHYRSCKKNPAYKNMVEKAKHTREKNINKVIRHLNCIVCGTPYELLLSDTYYNSGNYRKCCCKKCSNILTFMNKDKDKLNEKRSESARKRFKHTHLRICQNCGNEFWDDEMPQSYHSKKYCSEKCMKESRHKKLSEKAINRHFGGLTPETVHKNYKRGYYKGIYCDSSWELAYVIYCIEHGIQIERNYDFLEYVYEGKTFKFYPDFLVNGSLKEIKGFYTPKNKEKKEQCKTVEFIDKNKIKPYLSYVIDKYGKDFTYLYDNKNKHNESCDDSLCYSLF